MKLLIVYMCNNGYTCSCCGRNWDEIEVVDLEEWQDPKQFIKEERDRFNIKRDGDRIGIDSAYIIEREIY